MKFLTLLAGAAFAAAAAAGPSAAQTPPGAGDRWIEVMGEASVSARPNFATITLGVSTTGKDAGQTLAANAAATDRLIASIKGESVDPADIQTSSLSVSPNFANPPQGSTAPPAIVGYTVGNMVTVTVRDVSRLGPLLDRAVSAGANAMYGVTFGHSDPGALLDGVRRDAVKDARAKADLYASGAGAKIGRLLQLSEPGAGQPRPFARAYAAPASMAVATPIEAGQEKLTVTVTARFELTD